MSEGQGALYRIEIEPNAELHDLEKVVKILRQFNAAAAGAANYQRLSVLARNDSGELIGGLLGETLWGWLLVETLAVDEAYRHSGLGSRLLGAAEAEARKRGCKSVYLDTYSFQALDFYRRRGYEVFGSLSDFPESHEKYFLWKRLT